MPTSSKNTRGRKVKIQREHFHSIVSSPENDDELLYGVADGEIHYIPADGPPNDWDEETDGDWQPAGSDWIEATPLAQELSVKNHAHYLDHSNFSVIVEFSYLRTQSPIQMQFSEEKLIFSAGSVLRELVRRGYKISPYSSPRTVAGHITDYLLNCEPENNATVLLSHWLGWQNNTFCLPDSSYRFGLGKLSQPVIHKPSQKNKNHPLCEISNADSEIGIEGLLQWQEHISKYAEGNSRMVFALSAAFSAPLLQPLNVEGRGYNLHGETSSGKSIICDCAAGIFGCPETQRRRWGGSLVGLEELASAFHSLPLILDEIKQGNGKGSQLSQAIYALSHGTPRVIHGSEESVRGLVRTWKTTVLSSGEKSVVDVLTETVRTSDGVDGGLLIRFVDIPAEVSVNNCFECIHEFSDTTEFAEYLEQVKNKYFGHAGRHYMHNLLSKYSTAEELQIEFEEFKSAFVDAVTKKIRSGQASRVAKSMAVIAFAGEMATDLGITGWKNGEAIRSCKACFDAWHKDTLSGLSSTQSKIVYDIFLRHINSELSCFHDCDNFDLPDPKKPDNIGFIKTKDGQRIVHLSASYVLEKIYSGKASDFKQFKNVMKQHSKLMLIPDTKGRLTWNARLPGYNKSARFYLFPLSTLTKSVEQLIQAQ